MRWWPLLLVGSTACNGVFGIADTDLREILDAPLGPDADPRADLDRDGINDIEDPCIAPDTDLLIDTDFDGTTNGADSCAFVAGVHTDTDGDGIGDACDPSPGAERVRCLMAFTDPDFDISMWRIRDNPLAWLLYYPRTLVAVAQGSLLADWSFESPGTTTYEVVGYVGSDAQRFSVYPRAARTPSVDEIGCELVSGVSWSLAAGRGPQPATLGPYPGAAYQAPFWMQVTISPGAADGMTLRCRAQLGTGPVASIAVAAELPAGTLAFATSRGAVRGVVIYERADAP